MARPDVNPRDLDDFWAKVDERCDARIADALTRFEADARPRGLAHFAVTIDSPSASLVKPAAHVDIGFPCRIVRVTFRSAELGSAVLDVWTRRPGQTYADAQSIITSGVTYPAILLATDGEVVPADDWTVDLESVTWKGVGTTVYFFLRSVSGFSSLTINLWVRCV